MKSSHTPRNGLNKIMATPENIQQKTVFVGCAERTLVVSTFRYSFVCLHCVVPVSVLYRLCVVTVGMKGLQNGRLVRFAKRTDCWCAFRCSVRDQTATSLAVSRAAVPKVMTAYTDHQLRGAVAKNQNYVKGIAVHCRGLCIKMITELLQQR